MDISQSSLPADRDEVERSEDPILSLQNVEQSLSHLFDRIRRSYEEVKLPLEEHNDDEENKSREESKGSSEMEESAEDSFDQSRIDISRALNRIRRRLRRLQQRRGMLERDDNPINFSESSSEEQKESSSSSLSSSQSRPNRIRFLARNSFIGEPSLPFLFPMSDSSSSEGNFHSAFTYSAQKSIS